VGQKREGGVEEAIAFVDLGTEEVAREKLADTPSLLEGLTQVGLKRDLLALHELAQALDQRL
jgi:hypothetical protein